MWNIFFCFVLSFVIWSAFKKPRHNLPPGPLKFPIIGSMITLIRSGASRPSFTFEKLTKIYGSIFHIQTGSISSVVINDYRTIVEVSSRDEFLDRITDSEVWFNERCYGLPLGLALSKQNFWVQTRAITHKMMNKYAFHKNGVMKDLVLEGIGEFIKTLKLEILSSGGTVCIHKQFNVIFLHTVWAMFTCERLNTEDPVIKKLLEASDNYIKSGKFGGGIANLYPSLIHYFPGLTGFSQLKKMSKEFCDALESIVAKRRLEGFYKTEPLSFIDEFLREIERNKHLSDNPLENIFTEKNLVALLQDIIIGGNDTQSHTLKFAIQYFIIYREVQVKAREEVDRVIGRNRIVSLEDFSSLPYTQATLSEIQRLSTVVPLVPRIPNIDSRVGGYDIPKDTLVLCDCWSANHDESVWENPYEFKPERFIGDVGIKNASKILSFGSGKRRCPGDQISKTNLMLVLVSFIQNFEFEVDPVSGAPDPHNDIHGLARDALPFNIFINIRD